MRKLTFTYRPLTLGLLAINVLLIALVLWRLSSGNHTARILAAPSQTVSLSTPSWTAHAPPSNLAAIADQPLFHASRRFVVATAAQAAMPAVPDCRLVGTFMRPRQPGVALLSCPAGGESKKVRPGDELNGWRVKTVEVRRLVLQFGAHEIEIAKDAPPEVAGFGMQHANLNARSEPNPRGLRRLGTTDAPLNPAGADAQPSISTRQ